MQEIESELSLDLFDHIDDLLDFPNEDMDGKVGDGMDINWPSDDLFGVTSGTFTAHVEGGFDHHAGDFPLPCEDMAELEWLSNFVEDSFSGGSATAAAAAAAATAAVEDHNSSSHIVGDATQFRTSSPVSVLESSSCSGKALSFGSNDALPSVPAKARSKRPRPPAFSPRLPTTTANNSDDDDCSNNNLISPSSSASNPSSSDLSSQFQFEAESFAESKPPSRKVPKSVGGQRNRKAMLEQGNVAVRKCLHCGIQKTPQWRMGPMGPKTLCNACGVRYKSGRLFPEYRPAASPTFVASKHSNSHKKVMEMRTKKSATADERLVEKQQHELLFLRDTMVGYM
ncbi:GATA transcription factor 8-like isoform X2 [Nymphaea colorata]|uniref:GATA transcription factor 8-like isoform X2 n=1 Tax=Nymphaea colorata TaxID=210225 RepID=UPI00129E60B2|nr:GATA transcription factor 8-like isoform X2 [Nymphaea colorata]